MLFTDTDSVTYETFKSLRVFQVERLAWLSNYLKDSTIFDETNKKLLVKWNMNLVELL